METQYLKTLLTVMDSGSFSRAAEILSVTQSAVSHRVKFLEDHYACQLIDRSGSVLMPTEAGKRVMSKATQILALENELLQDLKRITDKSRLAICTTPAFGIHYLPVVMNRFFFAVSGNVDLHFMLMTPEQALKAVQNNEFDLSVVEHHQDIDFSGFVTYPLPQDEMVFVARPGSGLEGAVISVETLKGHRLITRKPGCSCRSLLDANFAAHSIHPSDFKGMSTIEDLQLMLQAARDGQGVAFVSRCLAEDDIKKGVLTVHRVEGFTHNRLRTVFHRKGPLEPNVLLFKDMVIDVCRELC